MTFLPTFTPGWHWRKKASKSASSTCASMAVSAPSMSSARSMSETRLVALASNHFVAGWRLELDAIGRHLRQRNILFCVDGIQTLGAFPTGVAQVDFLAADAHKWLLGPCGAAIFYVRKEAQAKLRPIVHGWHNVRCPDFVAQKLVYLTDARRYEAGSANLMGLTGLVASMELLLEIGVGKTSPPGTPPARLLAAHLAQARLDPVLQAEAPALNASAILSFLQAR